jgi:hypothetical protein
VSGPGNGGAGRTVHCRHCLGTAPRPDTSIPVGWLALTVSVPPEYCADGSGRTHIWLGLFCCAACLVAHGPEIERQQDLARQAYQAVVPDPPVISSQTRIGRPVPR